MTDDQPGVASLRRFGVSIFSEMSALAVQHQAINLAQGFPDFPAPELVKEAACAAIRADHNQYAPSHGVQRLRRALAATYRRRFGLAYDPETEVTVFSGATEALHAAIVGLVEPGDEVVCFEPIYDSYLPNVALAGGKARIVTLHPPAFELRPGELEVAFSSKTKLVLLNTPNNPSGKVFNVDELDLIGSLCARHGAILVSDEVYEHLTFDGWEHVPPATRPGLYPRTVLISSTAKTFSVTGWKIGYALAPAPLSRALRMAHQFVTFCSATPLQHALAQALEQGDAYYQELQRAYRERRQLLLELLAQAALKASPPAGTYFALADIRDAGLGEDHEFCQTLVREVGVAAIPASAFFVKSPAGRGYVRFSFCKQLATLRAAGERLRAWRAGRASASTASAAGRPAARPRP
jgi:N-succinyldiaminopimelate aminotransferase